MIWIDGANPLEDLCLPVRIFRPAGGPIGVGEVLQRCARLLRGELLGDEESRIDIVGSEPGELLEGAKRLLRLPLCLHHLRIGEKVLPSIDDEALIRPDLPQSEVGRGTIRLMADDLSANGHGVVRKAGREVERDRPLIAPKGSLAVAESDLEVSDPVVQGYVRLVLAGPLFFDRLQVQVQRPVPLFSLLVTPCFLLQ